MENYRGILQNLAAETECGKKLMPFTFSYVVLQVMLIQSNCRLGHVVIRAQYVATMMIFNIRKSNKGRILRNKQ